MQKQHIGLGILGLGVVVAAGFVLTRQPSEAQQPTPAPTSSAPLPAPQTPPAPEVSALTFDVNGGSFYFTPNLIKAKKGDTVTINFHNDGGFHDLNIDELGVKIGPLKEAGAVASATFVADKAGTFQYYCSIGHHRANGMWGTIVVE